MSSRREKAFLWPDGTEKIFIVYLNTLRVERDASDSCLYINMASGLDLQSEKDVILKHHQKAQFFPAMWSQSVFLLSVTSLALPFVTL